MEVNMAMDREAATVHTLNPVHGKGPVFYASLQHDADTPKGYRTYGEEAKHRLVCTLWEHLAAIESPLWQRCQSSNETDSKIQVLRGPLGKPQLLLGEYQGPAVSFSDSVGEVWAALCGDESDIGIDVAWNDEFPKEYPFHRVFHPEEIQHALRLAGGDLGNASALLWSVKESVVKALGCAFHLVDPLQITVCPSGEREAEGIAGHKFHVGLSGKALMRFPSAAHKSIWVRSLPQSKKWLSVAILKRRPTGNE
jgi:phosphopantetheinyl transferase